MTIESQAISHLRALIKDPLGHVAEACEFLARVDQEAPLRHPLRHWQQQIEKNYQPTGSNNNASDKN